MKSASERARADVDALLDALSRKASLNSGPDVVMVVLLGKILRELKEINYRLQDTFEILD